MAYHVSCYFVHAFAREVSCAQWQWEHHRQAERAHWMQSTHQWDQRKKHWWSVYQDRPALGSGKGKRERERESVETEQTLHSGKAAHNVHAAKQLLEQNLRMTIKWCLYIHIKQQNGFLRASLSCTTLLLFSYFLHILIWLLCQLSGVHEVNISIMKEWIQFFKTGTSITLRAFNTRTENQISGLQRKQKEW